MFFAAFSKMPTREDIWGLVINEAMAYGLPIITTDNCLAGLELIKNEENGYIIPVNNTELLAQYAKLQLIIVMRRLYKIEGLYTWGR